MPHDDAQNYYYSNYYSYLVYAQYMEMDLDERSRSWNMTKLIWSCCGRTLMKKEELIVALSICREENLTISEELYKRKLDEYAVEWGYENVADLKKVGKALKNSTALRYLQIYIYRSRQGIRGGKRCRDAISSAKRDGAKIRGCGCCNRAITMTLSAGTSLAFPAQTHEGIPAVCLRSSGVCPDHLSRAHLYRVRCTHPEKRSSCTRDFLSLTSRQ